MKLLVLVGRRDVLHDPTTETLRALSQRDRTIANNCNAPLAVYQTVRYYDRRSTSAFNMVCDCEQLLCNAYKTAVKLDVSTLTCMSVCLCSGNKCDYIKKRILVTAITEIVLTFVVIVVVEIT